MCSLIGVENGKVKKRKALLEQNGRLQTKDEDSQVWISFSKPIRVLYIDLQRESACNLEDRIDIYFSNKKRAKYSEDCCVKISVKQEQRVRKCISFPEKIYSIRLDPSVKSGSVFGKINVYGENSYDMLKRWICQNISQLKTGKRKILICSHELSESGAPILAYHIANGFKNKGYEVVALTKRLGDGFLEKKYEKADIPVIALNEHSELCPIKIGENFEEIQVWYHDMLWKVLAENGYCYVVSNSTICGDLTYYCKKNNMKVISLIHEMRTCLERYHVKEGTILSKYADTAVFPDDCVKEDFLKVFSKVQGKLKVRAQGLYLREGIKEEYKGDVYEELGIPRGKPIVIGSGYTHLVKGIDLFLGAAQNLISQEDGQEFHFIWLGNFDCKQEMEAWLMVPLEKEGLEERIHFIPFIQEQAKYKKVLEMGDIFWSTSRADSFPSTILEAMGVGVPVIAFKDAGGANTMLAEDRGILIPNFDIHEMAVQTKLLLADENRKEGIKEKARKYIEEKSDFMNYIDFLENLFLEEISE